MADRKHEAVPKLALGFDDSVNGFARKHGHDVWSNKYDWRRHMDQRRH